MKIVVTGARGFLGRHLVPRLGRVYGAENIVGVSRQDYDLMDPIQVAHLFKRHRPEILFHLAAYVGGIGANKAFPADFYYRNTLLTALMFQAAAVYGVQRMIYTMGGCSYPAGASSPIGEDQMWDGFPQEESAPYSTAKKMALVAGTAYRRQYGLKSIILVPGNMYGEYDNFRLGESHVVPAMIRRLYEARFQRAKEVVMWGTGKPVRDFVYAGDVADNLVHFVDSATSVSPVNISTGTCTAIGELCTMIAALAGYRGRVVWDSSKPDGQMEKIFDVTRMRQLGLTCPTSLDAGLQNTIRWFEENYLSRGDDIRVEGEERLAS